MRGGIDFYPSVLERGVPSEQALTLAMAEIYVQGVSTRKVSKIVEEFCGHKVSACTAGPDAELQLWRDRPPGRLPLPHLRRALRKGSHGGLQVNCAVLIAMGIAPDFRRTVLGVSTAHSEAEAHWHDFFFSLIQRGLPGVEFIVSDAHPAMAAARQAVFPAVPWQRCQFHLQQNAQAYVPRLEMRAQVADDLRSIFTSPDLPSAQARLKDRVAIYSKTASKLAARMEANVPQGFAVYRLPAAHRRRIRTSIAIEYVNQEFKRRTRGAAMFPNETTLLRLITALLCKHNDEWSTGKIYFNMNSTEPPQT